MQEINKEKAEEMMKKLDILQRIFIDTYHFPVFKELSVASISRLKNGVIDDDSLIVRFTDITKLIESINKTELDRVTKQSPKGEIASLEKYLKLKFPEYTHKIEDEIIIYLWSIYNIRSAYVHHKNRNYKRALEILELSPDSFLPEKIWNACLRGIIKSLTGIIELLLSVNKEEEQLYQKLAYESLFTEARWKVIKLISEYPANEKYLHILANYKEIMDTDLAVMLSVDVTRVRKDLYPFLSSILLYSYKGNKTTLIKVIDFVLPVVREVIEKG